ncbi:Fe2+-dependent dioxygenase [Polluticoccus soli]|uniref:Fe2+-dependent dioxygenase n=1 Tax=Polluticoccus soli TaxID=3034150 RepID=UPI0023E09715|nr:Fe2+-dependent dioxygenase [Flavipsychrobacter sp. JY13-12]
MNNHAIYLHVKELLNSQQLTVVHNLLETARYADGRETATAAARDVKNNLQVDMNAPQYGMLQQVILDGLNNSMLLRDAIFPKHVYPFLISKYTDGMEYGWHVDSPLMGNMMRTDIAITVFLNDPDKYEGGELELQSSSGTLLYKFAAGDAICYPCTQLHRVRPVIKGERRVAVSWMQSMVKDAESRKMLFDIQQVIDSLRAVDLQSVEAHLLQQTHSNLLRMWAD